MGAFAADTKPLRLSDIESCYVAALIDGLRLIGEKATDRGVKVKDVDTDALLHYVQDKAVAIAAANGISLAVAIPWYKTAKGRAWYTDNMRRWRAAKKANDPNYLSRMATYQRKRWAKRPAQMRAIQKRSSAKQRRKWQRSHGGTASQVKNWETIPLARQHHQYWGPVEDAHVMAGEHSDLELTSILGRSLCAIQVRRVYLRKLDGLKLTSI